MAKSTPIEQGDPGAPIAPGTIDPDLVKLARSRPKVGVITAAGLVVLSIVFLIRLTPDRRFSGASAEPVAVAAADIVAGKVEVDQLVVLSAEPVVAQAIRATKATGNLGHRVVPVRGTGDRLWIVMSGGWEPPAPGGYTGRLRKLDDLAFAGAARQYAAGHPEPVFASAAAIRAGQATGTITAVDGQRVAVGDGDVVVLDAVDAEACTIAASFNERLPDTAAWTTALAAAGVAPTATAAPDTALGVVRFAVAASTAATTAKLEAGKLLDARVEPITRHHQTTWGALRASPATGLDVGGKILPDAQIDLVGLFTAHAIPADAYAVVTGELPDDYWYVLPITIALTVILLVFAWALVRAIRRDFLAVRTA